jgi:iron complex outermembrane receptor protein
MGSDNNRAYVAMDFPEGDEFDNDLASVHMEYELAEHTLNFLYGYYDQSSATTWDADRTEEAFFAATVESELEAHSIELRMSSDYDGAFNWVAGIAYHDESSVYEEVGYMAPGILVAWGDLDVGDVVGDPDDYSLTDYAYVELSDLTTKAVFANVFWDMTDRLHLSAGLRYTEVEARFGSQCCGDDFGSPRNGRTHDELVAGLGPIDQPPGSSDEWNPRIALSYDLTDESSVYAQFSTGFRPGQGNDPRVVAEGIVGETADPEYMANYEVGYKANLLDRRLYVGLAAFYMDYTDLQVFREAEISVGGSLEGELFLGYTTNAGKANINGLEAEATWQVSDSLRFKAGVGYAHSVVEEFDDQEFDPPLIMPGVRPWTTSLTGEYETPISSSLTLGLRGEYRWQDEAWDALFEEEKNPGNFLPSWRTLDVSATITAERWSLQAYYENVLDEEYYTGQTSWSFRPTVYFIPRTYGARFMYNFGE